MSFVFLVVVILVSLQATLSLPIQPNALVRTLTHTVSSLTPPPSVNIIGTLTSTMSSVAAPSPDIIGSLTRKLHVTVPQPMMVGTSTVAAPHPAMVGTSTVTAPQPAMVGPATVAVPKLVTSEVIAQVDHIEPNIVSNLVEKSSIMQYNNKLVEEYDRLIISDDAKNFKWQVLSEVVKNIIDDKETLDYMLKRDNDPFKFEYERHFIQNKKAFSLFSSKDASFCLSILMCKYH